MTPKRYKVSRERIERLEERLDMIHKLSKATLDRVDAKNFPMRNAEELVEIIKDLADISNDH